MSIETLVIAAAQAAGPCPPGEEGLWRVRVTELAKQLYLVRQDVAAEVELLNSCARFTADLVAVEVEPSSQRGLLTLRAADGQEEAIRTQPVTAPGGKAMVAQARSLVGRHVLVYRYNEAMASNAQRRVRMVAHLEDQGPARGVRD